eukprot:839515-Ditylum_brightwellii.AAC.1
MRENFGFKIPINVKEALLLNKANEGKIDKKYSWVETILKKMKRLERFNIFQFHEPNKKFDRNEGWQYAPMRIIFDIKYDLQQKVRFVVGGHKIDSSDPTTYSSTGILAMHFALHPVRKNMVDHGR